MPILSIITINYNNASGLRKTIESVLGQTSHDFEHIIIDGGSTDGSVDVIRSFTTIPPGKYTTQTNTQPAPPITYWISEPDKGIYNAMNKGIHMAQGEFCQFLNSGDWLWQNDVTEKMLKQVPEQGILIGNMLKILANDKSTGTRARPFKNPLFLHFIEAP